MAIGRAGRAVNATGVGIRCGLVDRTEYEHRSAWDWLRLFLIRRMPGAMICKMIICSQLR